MDAPPVSMGNPTTDSSEAYQSDEEARTPFSNIPFCTWPERHLSFLKKGNNAARQGWAWETISQISESKACDAYSYSFEHGTPALKKGPSGVLSLGRSLSLFYFDILTGGPSFT